MLEEAVKRVEINGADNPKLVIVHKTGTPSNNDGFD